MRYSNPEMAAEHGHYCVWHPTFSYEVMNNRQDAECKKPSAKSSAVKIVKQQQDDEDEDAGFWVWSNDTQCLQYYAHAGAIPQIWQSGTGSSSSSGSHGPPVNHSINQPKKKAKRNHGQMAKKSPPLLHLNNVLNTF